MDEQQIIEKVEQVSEAATEAAVEAVPEIIETVEVVRNNPYILAGVALVAASTGALVGYKIAEKRLQTKFDNLMDEEIAKTKEHYARMNKVEDYETPESTVEKLVDDEQLERLTKVYSGETEEGELEVTTVEAEVNDDEDSVEVVKTTRRNIFVNGKDIEEYDLEAEMAKRTDDKPYVITQEEFFENEEERSQVNLTYYRGDDVLADEEDRTIDNADGLIGNENLQKFGYGSKDRNVVYVRNPKINVEYEIVHSHGEYSVEVLGMNSPSPRKPRKFRGDDD